MDRLQPLIDKLKEIYHPKFFGDIRIKFKEGEVVHIIKEESFIIEIKNKKKV